MRPGKKPWSLVAEKFAEAIKEHGADSVAYYGSGQCLSEESYLANRLFKGGIGTNNVEGNPRLCMASAVGGYVTTFGKDEPMGSYDDIAEAHVFFLVGSNTAESHPVIFDQILINRQSGKRAKVIMLDPRKTPVGAACRCSSGARAGVRSVRVSRHGSCHYQGETAQPGIRGRQSYVHESRRRQASWRVVR